MYYKLRCNSTQFVIYYKLRNYYKLQRNNAPYWFGVQRLLWITLYKSSHKIIWNVTEMFHVKF